MVIGEYIIKWKEVLVIENYIVLIVVDCFVNEFICKYGCFE